ncbi:DNA alkylation repair protein [Arenimonas composti]|uniref:DNA alkylation repair protein n=1 Tax=Arenimonas composti TR7-09 = DSM 18010 TaxID=1121013 RepID=A0A091BWK7_9GAMM|nr:DNA alkylation repair protein [Arenimonas composti]KFN48730.1 hypothetical protein P873_13820 [Arenimonas composti TR7-09 = DSM 18010]
MAEPFKNLLSPELVRVAGAHLSRAWPGFDRARFEAHALDGLEALEMKARAMHIADAFEATLPDDFDHAATVIEASLAPAPAPDDDSLGFRTTDAGLAGWIGWPLGEFIARRGVASEAHARRALVALHALTQRFSGEFAIRPLIVAYPDLVFATLQRWTVDPSAHVRRLASEGSRPRLPWGLQLKALIADPTPTEPILRALVDDPSAYVRRSVANHLNDIARDHPQRVVDWLAEFLPDAQPPRRALLKHASRTLLKHGHRPTLAAWGLGGRYTGAATLAITPAEVAIGDAVELELHLRAKATRSQVLAIDLIVHFPRPGGATRKVFKGWTFRLAGRDARTLRRKLSLRPVTTRRMHAGAASVEVQVNGDVVAEGGFLILSS